MADYDFHQLSPDDLEILARDLLQAHWGLTIESFKTDKDGGIDFRYAAGSSKIVVRVKHFLTVGGGAANQPTLERTLAMPAMGQKPSLPCRPRPILLTAPPSHTRSWPHA